jgi:hypothetical protein
VGAVIKYTDTNIPTPAEIRSTYCFGIPLQDRAGNQLDPNDTGGVIQGFIMKAVAEVERRLGVFLKPTIIKCSPNEQPYTGVSIGNSVDASYAQTGTLVQGTDYDLAEAPYDYDPGAYLQWGFMQLRQSPILTVDRVQLVTPNYLEILQIPTPWIKTYPEQGQFEIVPYAGSPTVMTIGAATGMEYPFLAGTFNRAMPQVIWVDYTAGYAQNAIPQDVHVIVAKIATIELLKFISDALTGGITGANASFDGISESVSMGNGLLYQSRIDQYQKDIDAFFDPKKGAARSHEKGFTMYGM